MAYFGGSGVQGDLHPSLRAYIDCFLSSPLPKVYPRGGGPWDQDPVLMRDFRMIRQQDVLWKEQKEQMDQVREGKDYNDLEGGGGGLGSALEDFIQDQEGVNDQY